MCEVSGEARDGTSDESLESNCSIIEKISPKRVSFQILLLSLARLSGLIRILIRNKTGKKSDMAKSRATFCCSGA